MYECVYAYIYNVCLQFGRCALFAKEMSKRRLKGGFFVYFVVLALSDRHCVFHHIPNGCLVGWLSMATTFECEFVYLYVCADCGKTATLHVEICFS